MYTLIIILTLSIFCKTPLGETGWLGNLYFYLLVAEVSSFLSHPNGVSWATYGYLPFTVQHLWLTVHYATPLVTRCFPIQHLPREVANFHRGDNHFKHMPPLTYLPWLQPICYNSRLVFIRVNTAKVLLALKTLIKN